MVPEYREGRVEPPRGERGLRHASASEEDRRADQEQHQKYCRVLSSFTFFIEMVS